jgi:hypothetical protein
VVRLHRATARRGGWGMALSWPWDGAIGTLRSVSCRCACTGRPDHSYERPTSRVGWRASRSGSSTLAGPRRPPDFCAVSFGTLSVSRPTTPSVYSDNCTVVYTLIHKKHSCMVWIRIRRTSTTATRRCKQVWATQGICTLVAYGRDTSTLPCKLSR